MAVEAYLAAVRGAKLAARVNPPIPFVTKRNVARASAVFPPPAERYDDPFARLLRRRSWSGGRSSLLRQPDAVARAPRLHRVKVEHPARREVAHDVLGRRIRVQIEHRYAEERFARGGAA